MKTQNEEEARELNRLIESLETLRFFPTSKGAFEALRKLVCSVAEDLDKAQWWIERTKLLFDEWPGERTFAAVYCRRFKPADGIERHTSEQEAERWETIADQKYWPDTRQIEPPQAPDLGPGDTEPAPDPPPARRILGPPRATREEIKRAPQWLKDLDGTRSETTPPEPRAFTPVTQEDIDRALEEYRKTRNEPRP